MQEDRQTKLLNENDRNSLIEAYKNAKSRLLLLDYDGTLVGFKNDPNAASPDDELLETMAKLRSQEGTKAVIISGRDRYTLGDWFGKSGIEMVSEHGVWIWKNNGWQVE